MKVQPSSSARLLIVDDDAEMRDALQLFCAGLGHECEVAASATAALGIVDRVKLDAILCDVRMTGMSGLELLDRMKRTHPAVPFVVITGQGGIDGAVDAVKRGAFQYLTKPCDLGALRRIVSGAIAERRRHEVEERSVRPTVLPPALARAAAIAPPQLVGSGPAMRALHECIRFVSASSAPVLITGETGVGKELVARAIHALGPRAAGPFVAINTSAIPETLLEAEMFGHARGAFTGAVHSRKGLLTDANGGTVLLDEIGDMPIGLQAKLLRVIQFGEVRPVGSNQGHLVDVRILAATHRDLESMIRAGSFREDLYFRLNVLPVSVPALRNRPEDIPELALHFLAEARRRAPHSLARSFGDVALHALTQAPWPGNARELASVVERAVVFATSEVISPVSAPSGTTESSGPQSQWPFPRDAPWSLRRLSRAYTDWILAETGGNKERAAEILGMDLSTLYRWQRAQRAHPDQD